MDRRESASPSLQFCSPSVVVHNFDVLCVAVFPHETDPILIIDPDAVLSPPITNQRLEVIARECAQILESLGCMQLNEFALRDPSDAPKPTCRITPKESLSIAIPERPDHPLKLLRGA